MSRCKGAGVKVAHQVWRIGDPGAGVVPACMSTASMQVGCMPGSVVSLGGQSHCSRVPPLPTPGLPLNTTLLNQRSLHVTLNVLARTRMAAAATYRHWEKEGQALCSYNHTQ